MTFSKTKFLKFEVFMNPVELLTVGGKRVKANFRRIDQLYSPNPLN